MKVGMWALAAEMRWVKVFLYLYVAQAAAGAAIGFTVPLVHLIGH
jgi:hypothetical protein